MELIDFKLCKNLNINFYHFYFALFRIIQLKQGDEVTGCHNYKINTPNEVLRVEKRGVELYLRDSFRNYWNDVKKEFLIKTYQIEILLKQFFPYGCPY